MIELNKIYNMDIRDGLLLLGDKSIDMTITSPPYFGLRQYLDNDLCFIRKDLDKEIKEYVKGELLRLKIKPEIN